MFAEPLKVALTTGVVLGEKPSEAEGADGAEGEIVPAEAEPAEPTGTRVVPLDTG